MSLGEGAQLGCSRDLDNPIWSKVFENKIYIQGSTDIDEDSVELDILDNGANYEKIPPWRWQKVGVALWSKVIGTSDHLRYLGVAGETAMTSWAMSFCFLLDSYDSGPP
jgi:hypothetical protein